MRVLVTGANGFVGRYLLRELAANGHEALAFDTAASPLPEAARSFTGDIRDRKVLEKILSRHQPDACVHLAGLTFVPSGWTAPEDMLAINVVGTACLLQTFRTAGSGARLIVASTAQVYGTQPAPAPLTEEAPLAPENLYAISKAAADRMALLYAQQHGMNVLTVRPHNHIGPGQAPQFVVPALARQIRAGAGGRATVKAGNLDSRRDFTDVRDVARAYRLLLEKGQPGRAYNIASGRLWAVADIVERLARLAGVQPDILRDEALYRPADASPLLDTGRIRDDTGWAPEIDLDRTLKDILNE
jgi:GDP-4-dehydro-6-deoxy-D-mannose reductase